MNYLKKYILKMKCCLRFGLAELHDQSVSVEHSQNTCYGVIYNIIAGSLIMQNSSR